MVDREYPVGNSILTVGVIIAVLAVLAASIYALIRVIISVIG